MSDDTNGPQVSARVDAVTIERLDAMANTLTKRSLGARVSRAAVVKQAILRGLDAMERETAKQK
jgi:hypothetical protein